MLIFRGVETKSTRLLSPRLDTSLEKLKKTWVTNTPSHKYIKNLQARPGKNRKWKWCVERGGALDLAAGLDVMEGYGGQLEGSLGDPFCKKYETWTVKIFMCSSLEVSFSEGGRY